MTAYGESEQILVPMPDGTRRAYSILHLLGAGQSILSSRMGSGMPPIRILEQSGPLQNGETLLGFRYGARTIHIAISEKILCSLDMADRRFDLTDLLRPSRSFKDGQAPLPLIYRKWEPGGKLISGTDLVTTAGSAVVTSTTGRFVHYGMRVGSSFTITTGADAGTYVVETVHHDGRITLETALAGTATGVQWTYYSEPSVRDLYCILQLGPAFDLGQVSKFGYVEALRLVAQDPFWYGADQTQDWDTDDDEWDALTFDFGEPGVADADAGAAFDSPATDSTWWFANNYVSSSISIPYWGHEGAVPVITITGPANDMVMGNTALDTQISFVYGVADGEVVTIDTFNLTATNGDGDDLFMYLTGDVSGFIISPDAANNRVNTLAVVYSGAGVNSNVSITWRNRYDSV